jgi:hypothetical protein
MIDYLLFRLITNFVHTLAPPTSLDEDDYDEDLPIYHLYWMHSRTQR